MVDCKRCSFDKVCDKKSVCYDFGHKVDFMPKVEDSFFERHAIIIVISVFMLVLGMTAGFLLGVALP